jgi:hypothetical protein
MLRHTLTVGTVLISTFAAVATADNDSHHDRRDRQSATHLGVDASEIVNLENGSDECPPGGTPNFRAINVRVLPDNTRRRFTIPSGKVLVITDFAWTSFGNSPGTLISLGLMTASSASDATSPVSTVPVPADALGRAAAQLHLTSGIVVARGITLCTNPNLTLGGPSPGFNAHVFGYLADAR